jgi:hypothetical protein
MRPKFPKKCKWNAFAIDRPIGVWKDEVIGMGKKLPLASELD